MLLGVDSLRGGLAEGNGISETDFFHTLTIQNDQISYAKHGLAPVHVFFTLFGCGGGCTKGSRAHNLLMQLSGLGSSKMGISETDFFHTLTIQNDQMSHVKHVLAPPHVFLTLFGCWGGGVPRGLGHNLLMKFSPLAPLPSSRCLAEGNRIIEAWACVNDFGGLHPPNN